jgi:hypothetical protein
VVIVKVLVLGVNRGCVGDEFFVCGGNLTNADVVIDLSSTLKNLDVAAQLIISSNPEGLVSIKRRVVGEIMVGGAVLRTLIGLGELVGEPAIRGVRGEVFGVSVNGKVVLFARPLMINLIHNREPLINEIKLLLNNAPPSVSIDSAINELVSLVLSERRSKRVSRTLAYLEGLLQDGDVSKLPPYIMDILTSIGAVHDDVIDRGLVERLINEIKARVYPRRG